MQIRLFLCRNLIQTDHPHFGKISCRVFVEYRRRNVSVNNITAKKFALKGTICGADLMPTMLNRSSATIRQTPVHPRLASQPLLFVLLYFLPARSPPTILTPDQTFQVLRLGHKIGLPLRLSLP